MKRLLILIVLLLSIVGLTVGLVSSEPLDPDYNWCEDALVWGDGRCDNHDDADLIFCHWEVGWYMPRIENGEIDLLNVKSGCFNIKIEEVFEKVEDKCRRFLVVLVDSPYLDTDGRAPDLLVEDTNFNGWDQDRKCGLTIHGTDEDNFLAGSAGDDIIYSYDGFDILIGDGTEYDEDIIADFEDLIGDLGEGLGESDFGEGFGEGDFGEGFDDLFGDCFCEIEDEFGGDAGGDDQIFGGDGDDIIIGDYLLGAGTGDDEIDMGGGFNLVVGDTLVGLGGGNDTITGGDCEDCGELGDFDSLDDFGELDGFPDVGDNVDIIIGDTLLGVGFGDDDIDGGSGLNVIVGDTGLGLGIGDDTITGGDDVDIIIGDTVIGLGGGDDDIDGGDGFNVLVGDTGIGDGVGDDTIDGGEDTDIIIGDTGLGSGIGNDDIDGGGGDDVIFGDVVEAAPILSPGDASGDDDIDGGDGVDVVTGPGNDGDDTENVEIDTSTGDE